MKRIWNAILEELDYWGYVGVGVLRQLRFLP